MMPLSGSFPGFCDGCRDGHWASFRTIRVRPRLLPGGLWGKEALPNGFTDKLECIHETAGNYLVTTKWDPASERSNKPKDAKRELPEDII